MALARTHAMSLVGVQGHPVEIEADIENGLVALLLVGLPDTALREARDRIRAAIINSGESWPQRRITVGLSPASLPKRGSSFDLGIAIAILAAAGVVPAERLAGMVFLGELGLDGRVRPVPGVLPAAAAAATAGFQRIAVAPGERGRGRADPGAPGAVHAHPRRTAGLAARPGAAARGRGRGVLDKACLADSEAAAGCRGGASLAPERHA